MTIYLTTVNKVMFILLQHSTGSQPTQENSILCVRGGGQKTKRKSSRAGDTEKVTPENSKKKRTAAGGKKTTIGAKTRTPAALGAVINSLARIRKTATSGQSKTTPSREMNRKRKAEDQFKVCQHTSLTMYI